MTTDVSNTELVFCIWYVDEQLKSHEVFIGLHNLDSRGQCYNGTSAMAVCKTGVATTLLLKGATSSLHHYYGHTLNLAVQESVKANHILRETLDTVEEMTKLIKKLPKHETILFQKVKNDIAC